MIKIFLNLALKWVSLEAFHSRCGFSGLDTETAGISLFPQLKSWPEWALSFKCLKFRLGIQINVKLWSLILPFCKSFSYLLFTNIIKEAIKNCKCLTFIIIFPCKNQLNHSAKYFCLTIYQFRQIFIAHTLSRPEFIF